MPQVQSIVGMPSGFTPSEYPKAVYDKDGKSALARNPDHAEELKKQGFAENFVAVVQAVKAVVAAPAGDQTWQKLEEARETIKKMSGEMMSLVEAHSKEIAEFITGSQALKEELSAAKVELLKYAEPVSAPAPITPPKLTPPLQPKAAK